MNILTQPTFSVEMSEGKRTNLNLPEVFASLDEIRSFSRVRPHQNHAWLAFLTQLGMLGKAAYGPFDESEPAEWHAALRALTPQYPLDEPWTLVVEDTDQPAFLQSPTTRAEDYKRVSYTPDALDLLVASRNHEVKEAKSAVAHNAPEEDWIYSLVSVQTCGGYSGSGNHGISRMNGGFGNRNRMSLSVVGTGEGAVVRRDMNALENWGIGTDEKADNASDSLMWLYEWDGEKEESLPTEAMHPLYIEICRRVRLERIGRTHIARRASSKAARMVPVKGGLAFDPWMPVNMKEQKVLSVAQGGFPYNRVADYMSDKWELPLLAFPTQEELSVGYPMELVCKALVRGQGTTEGYYERHIELPYAILASLANDRDTLSRALADLLEDASALRSILRHALGVCAAAGKSPMDKNDKVVTQCLSALTAHTDESFFVTLGDYVEELLGVASDGVSARDQWALDLIDFGRQLLVEAQEYMSLPGTLRYRAFAKSKRLYESRIRSDNRGFARLFAANIEETDETEQGNK